jgi:hypothetical protein
MFPGAIDDGRVLGRASFEHNKLMLRRSFYLLQSLPRCPASDVIPHAATAARLPVRLGAFEGSNREILM